MGFTIFWNIMHMTLVEYLQMYRTHQFGELSSRVSRRRGMKIDTFLRTFFSIDICKGPEDVDDDILLLRMFLLPEAMPLIIIYGCQFGRYKKK
jgi:hypothetical protein